MKRSISELEEIARTVRRDIINMAYAGRAPHIGASLSTVEILTTLYFEILKLKPGNPDWEGRDRFILSKGHAVSSLYAILAHRGYFPVRKLKTYLGNGSDLPGHPEFKRLPGVEVSSGSLGHGLALGAGMALAAKLDSLKWRVFVLLSDGECDEGEVWETALFAGHHKLNNLTAVVDYNKLQGLGKTKDILNLEPFAAKWRAFGWRAVEADGHDLRQLLKALRSQKKQPTVVIAHTIKGKGVSFMEGDYTWHYHSLDHEHYEKAQDELKNVSGCVNKT